MDTGVQDYLLYQRESTVAFESNPKAVNGAVHCTGSYREGCIRIVYSRDYVNHIVAKVIELLLKNTFEQHTQCLL
jgi:hypothetical protein